MNTCTYYEYTGSLIISMFINYLNNFAIKIHHKMTNYLTMICVHNGINRALSNHLNHPCYVVVAHGSTNHPKAATSACLAMKYVCATVSASCLRLIE